jgi:putative ABC transport system permease protein
MQTLFQDIRYGWRMIRKSPIFAAVTVLTLALGIGANTAIFSVINAVLLRPLPYPDANRLMKITFNNPGIGLHDVPFSYPELDDLRTKSGVFDEVSVVWPSDGNLTGAHQPTRLELLAVSPNYFSMLGAVPQVGRLFGPQDIALGFSQSAVISNGLWQRSYGGDPNVIGKNLQIDSDPYTIVGVAAPGFRHPGKTIAGDVEVWLTAGFSADPFSAKRNEREIAGAIGRLKPGISNEQAQAKLNALAGQIQKDYGSDYPADAKWSIEIEPLQQTLVGNIRVMLLALMAFVVIVIIIASANIANLLLARAAGRQQEMALRLALGATRSRMVRQMLTESVMLSLLAGLAGILGAAFGLSLIVRWIPARIPRMNEVGVDWVVLGFALLISMLTGLLFGLIPAIQSTKRGLLAGIREGSAGAGQSGKTNRWRAALIVSEVSLAVVLMVGAGLLLRTFWGLLKTDPGFNPSRVVAAGVWLPAPNDPKNDTYADVPHQAIFVHEALRRVSAIPGVELAAISSALPASGAKPATASISIVGRPANSAADRAEIIRVSPDYFKVLQTQLDRGRFFTEDDGPDKDVVVIVDERTARRYWPDQDALGAHMMVSGFGGQKKSATVVGIVKDIKHDGFDKDGMPHLYMSIYQRYGKVLSVVVRSSLLPSTLEPQIRAAVEAIDPNLPVFGVRSMDEVIDVYLAQRRFSAELVAGFAGLALLVASIGIYGLLAYMVGQRTREIGLRMALGAQRFDVLKLFLANGVFMAGAGIIFGLIAALLLTPLIASLLYGVRPMDPMVFFAVPVILFSVALLASYIPALRAARVNPITTLREG